MTNSEMMRWCHNVERGPLEEFEDIADWFHAETGYLRPGKSDARPYNQTYRQEVSDKWIRDKQKDFRDSLLDLLGNRTADEAAKGPQQEGGE